jgi:hypothetical protein
MDLDDRDIQEFIQLWKEEFKETLSPAVARQCASQLLELYGVLASPLPEERRESRDGQHNDIEHPCDISSTAENPAKTKTARSSP